MLKAPAAVTDCANDIDATACLADVSLSASDHYISSVNSCTNKEAGSPCVIEICPQVCVTLPVYSLLFMNMIYCYF